MAEMDFRYVIGIDGGGTKTAGALVDPAGQVLSAERCGASNPNDVGVEEACKRIGMLANALLEKAGVAPEETFLFGGIAGVIQLREQMLAGVAKYCPRMGRIGIDTDLVNLLSSELPVGDGACVICGTGSACFLRRGEELIRIGGWGYLLDSAGSGYDIGREALEAVLRAHDRRGEATVLSGLLAEALGAPVQDNISRLYREGKPCIASMAPYVFTAAERGDAVAERILQRNAAAIAEYIRAARSFMNERDPTAPLPVVMGGGINQHEPSWIARVSACLEPAWQASLRVATAPPLFGAIMEGWRRSGHPVAYEEARRAFTETYERN